MKKNANVDDALIRSNGILAGNGIIFLRIQTKENSRRVRVTEKAINAGIDTLSN